MFILGGIIFSGISVYATFKAQADEIEYENGVSVKDKIDDLYSKTSGKKICLYVSGTKGSISSKYLCDPGDGVARYFYILKTDGTNVRLIMEKNISDTIGNKVTMDYAEALILKDNVGSIWKNVSVDLPSAQDIANAANVTGWNVETEGNRISYFGNPAGSTWSNVVPNYSWLFNYTRNCNNYGVCNTPYPDSSNYPYGYWTKDYLFNDNGRVWQIDRNGCLSATVITGSGTNGVRPVITISANQLSN